MNELSMKQLQDYLSMKYMNMHDSASMFFKLVEEVGEVAEAMNQLAGRKNLETDVSLEKELADIIHYTVAIANIHSIDLSKAIIEKDRYAAIKYHQSPNLEEFIKG